MLEEGWQITAGNVEVFVNGGCQNLAAVLQVPSRVIGAAAEKGDAVRGAGNDHSVNGYA